MSLVPRPPFIAPVCYPCESALGQAVALCEGEKFDLMQAWDCSLLGRDTLKMKEDCLRSCAEEFCAASSWGDYCTEMKLGYQHCEFFGPCGNIDFTVQCSARMAERCAALLTVAPLFPASQVFNRVHPPKKEKKYSSQRLLCLFCLTYACFLRVWWPDLFRARNGVDLGFCASGLSLCNLDDLVG